MEARLLIRERLEELRRDQKELAAATGVTESYISQLLTGKKSPPTPNRTDIYEKMEAFLKLPRGKLANLATLQRVEEVRRSLGSAPAPLNAGVREFILFKCDSKNEKQIRADFENHAFGTAERLVTRALTDVAKTTARGNLRNEERIRALARASGRSFEEARVAILDFLDTHMFSLTMAECESYLDPLITSWTMDLLTLRIDISLNRELCRVHSKRFEFVETGPVEEESGFEGFLRDSALSGNATESEIAFLRSLRFTSARPTPMYYYRELQNLRDPLHFRWPNEE
jgi:transcriptional regulator with XRE-family HTH domain